MGRRPQDFQEPPKRPRGRPKNPPKPKPRRTAKQMRRARKKEEKDAKMAERYLVSTEGKIIPYHPNVPDSDLPLDKLVHIPEGKTLEDVCCPLTTPFHAPPAEGRKAVKRASMWNEHIPDMCEYLCGKHGLRNDELAKVLGISEPYLVMWKQKYPRLAQSIQKGIDTYDSLGAENSLRSRFLGYTYQLMAIQGWTSVHWLRWLRHPTLVLAGDDDPIIPVANGRILASRIPNGRLDVVEGGGHLFLFVRGEEMANRVRNFLDTEDPEDSEAG